ncbi:MAG: hypothetical protein JW984_05755 [Deltaproteobacteria bacterium]|uniref:Uncharacterized protein n=1 Tax=Candidatus Zymogenus saltonus TaxID=2844893 RepID=A0A9D8PP06_9DELT|nr:hypothetical protein [Candidatus Zymogenus saltonus]
MGLKLFRFSIILLVIYMPIHIAVFFAAPGPILIGDAVDEMTAESILYQRQLVVTNIALEYLDLTIKALEIEAELGNMRELNELVKGERKWRNSLVVRINRIESDLKSK